MDGWMGLVNPEQLAYKIIAKNFATFPKAIDLFSNIQIIIKIEMHKIYKIRKLVSELALKQWPLYGQIP